MTFAQTSLKPDTRLSLLAEIATRDGAETTGVDVKVEQVLRQSVTGQADLHWHEKTQTASVVDRRGIRRDLV
jgi:uncharacterized protein YheU (UPF0270 family)